MGGRRVRKLTPCTRREHVDECVSGTQKYRCRLEEPAPGSSMSGGPEDGGVLLAATRHYSSRVDDSVMVLR